MSVFGVRNILKTTMPKAKNLAPNMTVYRGVLMEIDDALIRLG